MTACDDIGLHHHWLPDGNKPLTEPMWPSRKVLWHLPESEFTRNARTAILYNEFEHCTMHLQVLMVYAHWFMSTKYLFRMDTRCISDYISIHVSYILAFMEYVSFLGLCRCTFSSPVHNLRRSHITGDPWLGDNRMDDSKVHMGVPFPHWVCHRLPPHRGVCRDYVFWVCSRVK